MIKSNQFKKTTAAPGRPLSYAIAGFDVNVDDTLETQFTVIYEGRVIGRVGVRCAGWVATIRQLYVDPEYRRQGIGMHLLDKCVAAAFQAGCVAINLAVATSNLEVIPWYKTHGFFVAHIFGDGEVLMARPIR